MKRYRYYLGRISKGGILSTEDIMNAIMNPKTIKKSTYSYTFANMYYDESMNYIYGKLVKFIPEGEVETIEPLQHRETSVSIPHKRESSSPFVIALDYMGIAYPTIWNNLLKDQFERYFCELIKEKFEDFFVSCKIEPVVNLRTFVERVATMDQVDKISATVMPPNPLFGPAWKELKEYMEYRGSGEITISEKSKYASGIKTKIMNVMTSILEAATLKNLDEKQNYLEEQKYDISDAAILMAADGYGRAKIEGLSNNEVIIIRTKDNQSSFLYEKDPDRQYFYEIVLYELQKINEERYLKH